jgi:hypothetical protein
VNEVERINGSQTPSAPFLSPTLLRNPTQTYIVCTSSAREEGCGRRRAVKSGPKRSTRTPGRVGSRGGVRLKMKQHLPTKNMHEDYNKGRDFPPSQLIAAPLASPSARASSLPSRTEDLGRTRDRRRGLARPVLALERYVKKFSKSRSRGTENKRTEPSELLLAHHHLPVRSPRSQPPKVPFATESSPVKVPLTLGHLFGSEDRTISAATRAQNKKSFLRT